MTVVPPVPNPAPAMVAGGGRTHQRDPCQRDPEQTQGACSDPQGVEAFGVFREGKDLQSRFPAGRHRALSEKFLEGRVAVDTAFGRFVVAGAAAPGQSVTLSVRPEHLRAEGGADLLPLGPARVLESGFFGTHHQCTAALEGAGSPFKVRLPQKHSPAPGAELSLWVDPADLVLLTR